MEKWMNEQMANGVEQTASAETQQGQSVRKWQWTALTLD